MDAISYSYADKQAKRIKKFIDNPDSNSGIVTVPKTIGAGENITIPAGRVAVLPNVQVDGTLNIEGEVFVPSGATFGDLENQIALKADTSYVNNKYSGFKNYIINGNFDIAQRGETHTIISPTHGFYHLDRWCSSQFGSGGTQSVQKIDTTVNGANVVALRTYQVTACYNRIIQILDNESSKSLRGKKMSVSFWYRAKGNILCRLQQRTDRQTLSSDFATEFSEHIGTAIGASSGLIADETWRYASFTTTVSSANGFFHLVFYQNIAADNYYEITKVQLEEGSVATPFEQRPYGLELSLCQRYYESSADSFGGGSSRWSGYAISGVAYSATTKYKVRKRVVPTVVLSNVYTSGFSSTVGVVNGGHDGFAEDRVANVTSNSATFISSFTASAEL